MRFFYIVLLLSLITLSSCTGHQNTTTTLEKPLESNHNYLDIPLLVTDFLSEISTQEDLQLKALMIEALQNNRKIQQRFLEIEKTYALYRKNRSSFFPSLNLSFSPGLANTAQAGQRKTQDSYGLSLSSSWEVDLWKKIADQAKAGLLNVTLSQEEYYNAQISLASKIAQQWYELIKARQFKTLSELNYEIRERSLKKTKRRFYLGRTKGSDVRIAQTSLANAEATKSGTENNLKQIKRGMEILLGRYPSTDLVGKNTIPELARLTLTGEIQDFIENRPDVQIAALGVKTAGLNVDIARKSLYPALSLSGSLRGSSLNLHNLFTLDQWAGSLVASFLQPLFKGGALKANIDQQKSRYKQALLQYGQAVLEAALEIENTLETEVTFKKEKAAYQKAFESALSASKQVEQQYNEGLTTIFDLLSSQRQRFQAEQSLITAKINQIKNRINLKTSLGGSWKIKPLKKRRKTPLADWVPEEKFLSLPSTKIETENTLYNKKKAEYKNRKNRK